MAKRGPKNTSKLDSLETGKDYTVKEVQENIGISRPTIEKMITDKRLIVTLKNGEPKKLSLPKK